MKTVKNNGRYEIVVKRDLCIGAASCVAIAPKTYELDSETKAMVKKKPWDKDEAVVLAAQSCPTSAIFIIDKKTGKQVWPKK